MSDYTITYSSELMRNYLQAEIMAPEAKLQALQARDGTSLLFSVGTDHALYLTRELPGERSGWARSDLSSGLIASDFAGQRDVAVKDFATAQPDTAAQSSIHLAMVLSGAHDDQLYLSLGNSSEDTSWADAPSWVPCPFDDPGHPLSGVRIAGVFISEATDGEYIVVDVLRDPSSAQPLVFRYYLDLADAAKPGGHAWHPHDLSIDLEAGRYSSCLGRRPGQYVDGLYTAGQVGGLAQLIYQPLYNPFNKKVAPSPSLLQLPGGLRSEAIAACRNPDNTSDLYVTSGDGLYYFSSQQQQSGATAKLALSSPRFRGVRSLFATVDGGNVLLWGLNGNDEIFYTTCPRGSQTAGEAAWSAPLPIITGAEQVAPYLDHANSANTFFCHTGGNKLTKAVKSPSTGMWSFRSVTLEPLNPATKAARISSYTTRIVVTSAANGQPAAGVPVTITATSLISVRINYLYYVIGANPVEVTTDPHGTITLVEPVDTLAGTRILVAAGGAEVEINPMDTAFAKAASLDTPGKLSSAVITSSNGSTRPLIQQGASQDDLQAVADGNQALAQAYQAQPSALASLRTSAPALTAARAHVPAAGHPSARAPHGRSAHGTTPATDHGAFAADHGAFAADAGALLGATGVTLWASPGDFFAWLGQEAERAVTLVAGPDAWSLIATIAGETVRCVLDCVEHIVAAAQWLYDKVVTALKDLIEFLEFLFEWADITRTKKVIEHSARLYVSYLAGQLPAARDAFDEALSAAEQTVNGWAGVDWTALGADGQATPDSTADPSAGQSAPGSLLQHHYQHNAQNTTPLKPLPAVQPPPGPLDALIQAVEREGATIAGAVDRLQEVADGIGSRPVADTLAQMIAIVTDLVLESARTVVDALADILIDAAGTVLELLDTPIHISGFSDILDDFGVPHLSMFDVACWICAVPATLTFKIAEGRAPFPDDGDTALLTGARDFEELLAVFHPQQQAPRLQAPRPHAEAAMLRTAGPAAQEPAPSAQGADQVSANTVSAVHVLFHCVAGFCSLVSAIVSGFEAAEEDGSNDWSIPAAILGVLGGASDGIASAAAIHLVPYDAIQNRGMEIFNDILTGYRILYKIVGFGMSRTGYMTATKARVVTSIADAVLAYLALIPVGWHFHELADAPRDKARNIAILEETSYLTSMIARVCYTAAVNSEGPEKAVAIGLMTVGNISTGGLQIAETLIH